MKTEEVQKIKHGLYRVHWKSGGYSLAAVGSMYDGQRWLAPTNWTSDMDRNPGAHGAEVWEKVWSVENIDGLRFGQPPTERRRPRG